MKLKDIRNTGRKKIREETKKNMKRRKRVESRKVKLKELRNTGRRNRRKGKERKKQENNKSEYINESAFKIGRGAIKKKKNITQNRKIRKSLQIK